MARPSISVVLNSAPQVDTSGFSEQALEWGWNTMTQNLCNALAKVLSMAKNVSDFERADARNTSYTHLYGAEDACPNISRAGRRKKHDYTYDPNYNYYSNQEGFYIAGLQLATNMYGLTTGVSGDLPTTDIYPSTLSSYNSSTDQYSRIITYLENFGLTIHSGWKIDQYLTDIAYNETTTINDENSFFNGVSIQKTTSGSSINYGLSNGFYIFRALYHIVGHFHILRRIAELTSTARGGRGGTAFNPSATPRASQIMFSRQCLPHDLIQVRQALSQVWANCQANGYDPYNPGTSTTSITSGRIKNRIKKALSNRGITFASALIPDMTKDISDYYTRQATIDDPLIISSAGFVAIEQQDSYDARKAGSNSWWGAFVPAVNVCRRYLMRSYMIAYDYKETTNPNVFEKEQGKVAYLNSNRYVYLNSRCQSSSSWKIKTHEYDEYWTGSEPPYLNSISQLLRANIAKPALGYNPGETLARDINRDWPPAYFHAQWAFLPTLTMFGVENKKASRAWTNVQVGLDASIFYDASDGEWYGSAGINEADLLGDSFCFEELEEYPDLLENAWELGNRRYQFMVNPQCADYKDTTRTYLYIPTQTPAVYTADTRDTTIPNRVACFYLPKADGTATTSQMGQVAPYNTNPFTVAFTLVPFYTAETDNIAKECVSEPILSYSATEYKDL